MASLREEREFAVSGPLAEGTFLLGGLSGEERLGRPFEYRVELLSEDDEIGYKDVLGQALTVRMRLDEESSRYFSGHVARFARSGRTARYTRYSVTLRPWLWLLGRTSDCRIFQNASVPDIVKAVFREHGFTDFEESLSGRYAPREYCVQYRESDLDFVSRLLESEGIYYFFRHEDGKHTLVLADAYGAHERTPGYETLPYRGGAGGSTPTIEQVDSWGIDHEVQPGAFALTDFDFNKPRASLAVSSSKPREHANDAFEVFDFPGGFAERADGESFARTRIEELHARFERAHGSSNARGLHAGGLFELTDGAVADHDREWLIVATRIQVEGSGGSTFTCAIEAIDARQPYRSARSTPRPRIRGPQTALVVGKAGEEIWTDRFGRIKLQFHWDREGRADENSSCWVRVAQTQAGKRWGSLVIPRIGQEVLVEFLDGDPDRPIVTGCVYNADCMPPYALPDKAHVTTFKSNSTKGGGGSNELRLDDTKGKEELYLHAQRDHVVEIGRDDSRKVGRKLVIDAKDEIVFKCGRSQVTLKKDGSVSIKGVKIQVEGASRVEVKSNGQVNVKGAAKVALESNGQFQARGQMTKIQGTMLDLKGQGIASLKGALTKIG